MTHDEIDRMSAGRELDAAVAVVLFGWEWFAVERHYEPPRGREMWRSLRDPKSGYYGVFPVARGDEPIWDTYGQRPPKFSTDIFAAWQVAEKMHEGGDCLNLSYQTGCFVGDVRKRGWAAYFRMSEAYAAADTAPLAICKVALKAVLAAPPPASGEGAG
jgi:hypothetical protein